MIRRHTVLSTAMAAALILPTAVVAAGSGASAAPAVSSARLAAAATDISVTGSDVSTWPAFSPTISRYAIANGPAADGAVTVDVAAPAGSSVLVNGAPATGPTTVSGLEVGDEVSVIVKDGSESAAYAFIYLPKSFPELTATVPEQPGRQPGLVGLTLNRFGQQAVDFEAVVDGNGVPAHAIASTLGVLDLKVQPNGSYTAQRLTNTPGRTGGALVEMDETFTEIKRFETAGLVNTDGHDSILRPDGSVVLIAYEFDAGAGVADDVVPGVTDSVIQELDPAGNVVFEWNSRDDLLAESVNPGSTRDGAGATIIGDIDDYAHINSVVEMEDGTGDFVASFRHTSSVLRIARTAHDGFAAGDVVWRLGGRNSDFDFVDDPFPGGPCAQHTASVVNGDNILIYDNGSASAFTSMCIDPADPSGAPIQRLSTRVTEYDLGDVDNDPATQEAATLVWSYDPGYFGFFAGGAVRLDNGNTLIGYAAISQALAAEVNSSGERLWEIKHDEADAAKRYAVYRAAPFPAANDLDALDPTAEIVTPAADQTFQVGERVVASATCTDAGGSTLQSCSGSGELLDTSSAGTQEFTTTATDGAGNTTTVRRSYTVIGAYQPDLRMKVAGSALVGNDRYGLAGQRAVRTVRKARQVRTVMSIQNDGTVNDSFGVKATVRKKGFVTKFYSGGRDVTQQVKRGTFRTRTMAPGRTAKLVVKTKRLNRVKNGSRWGQIVKVTSQQDSRRSDRMRHVVRAVR